MKQQALMAIIPGEMTGRICVTELSDRGDWADQPLKQFKDGTVFKVGCRVESFGSSGRDVTLLLFMSP